MNNISDVPEYEYHVYIVFSDDGNENDCGCYLESIDSVYFNEDAAISLYHGRVDKKRVI